jgi:tetratricopeptide (TPR) repeat protein
VVYKARQVSLDRVVALKMILAGAHADAEQRDRFRREAEAAARLRHPNVVQVHEVGEAGGLPFLAMEHVEGPSLGQWLADRHARGSVGLALQDAALLVETVARAMDHAHRHGVVHRDLKPANILLQRSEVRGQKAEGSGQWSAGESGRSLPSDLCPLTSDLWPKVTDFGLAKRLDDTAPLTQTGAVLGTPSYMAPEQVWGKAVGPSADVYALGAILYECLTGRPPFVGETTLEVLEQVARQDPVPPGRLRPRLPRDLQTICLKCLEKDPPQRYATAGALAEDLRRFRAGEPIRARRTSAAERAVKWVKRRPVVAALTAAVMLTTLLAAGGWTWRELDRAAQRSAAALRRDSTARQAQQVLAQASELRAGGQRAQALAQARRAEGMLEHADGLEELRQQARDLVGDLQAEERGQRLLSQLGQALQRAGLFRESLRHYQRGYQLGAKDPAWRGRSTLPLRHAESLVALDENLPAVLKGTRPGSPGECLGYAQVCYHKQLYGASARFFETALTGKAGRLELGEGGKAAQWFNAACAAAKAGCGQGKDSTQHDEPQRSSWRKKALGWLQASLGHRRTQLAGDPQARAEARETLKLWQRTRALSGLRDPEALARLDPEEREVCRRFWADVAALLPRAEGNPQ